MKNYQKELERVFNIAKKNYSNNEYRKLLAEMFPELAEGESERIRKALIALLEFGLEDGSAVAPGFNETKEQALAWLEEQKELPSEDDFGDFIEKLHNQFPEVSFAKISRIAVRVKKWCEKHMGGEEVTGYKMDKFKVGDWASSSQDGTASLFRVVDKDAKNYRIEDINGNSGAPSIEWFDKNYHPWSIKEARDGEVLVDSSGNPFIYAGCDVGYANCYVALYNSGLRSFSGSGKWEDKIYVRPATKSQRDSLFTKMKELGYKWDSKNKTLTKLKFKVGDWVINKSGDVWKIDSFDSKNYQVSNGDKFCYFPIENQDEMRLWTPDDEIKKFKVGDWIVSDDVDYAYRITDINDGIYYIESEYGDEENYMSEYIEKNYHHWSLKKAKEGSVISYGDEISMFKGEIKNPSGSFGGFTYFCCCDGKKIIINDLYSLTEEDLGNIHPADKHQRDLLYEKLKDYGYDWDAEGRVFVKKQLDDDIELYYRTYGNGRNAFDGLSLEQFKAIVKQFVNEYGGK